MSIEENKALFLRFCELENQHDVDGLFTFLTPGYTAHYGSAAVPLDQLKQTWPALWSAFPDIHFTVEQIIAEGNRIAVRESWTGTHQGEFQGIPPTGKKVTMINTCILRVENGRLAESWCTLDELGMMKQLGIVPE